MSLSLPPTNIPTPLPPPGRFATADYYMNLMNEAKGRKFPCKRFPNCCTVPGSFCCAASYAGPLRAGDSLRPTHFDIDSVVGSSARCTRTPRPAPPRARGALTRGCV